MACNPELQTFVNCASNQQLCALRHDQQRLTLCSTSSGQRHAGMCHAHRTPRAGLLHLAEPRCLEEGWGRSVLALGNPRGRGANCQGAPEMKSSRGGKRACG